MGVGVYGCERLGCGRSVWMYDVVRSCKPRRICSHFGMQRRTSLPIYTCTVVYGQVSGVSATRVRVPTGFLSCTSLSIGVEKNVTFSERIVTFGERNVTFSERTVTFEGAIRYPHDVGMFGGAPLVNALPLK